MAQVTQSQDEAMAQKWSNRRKWFLWIIGAVLVYIVLYLMGAELPGAENASTTTTAESPTTREATVSQPVAPITLSGSGQSIADVKLERGLARFSMKHEGSGHFSIVLLTAEGERAVGAGAASESLLANTSGLTWEGQKAVRIDKAGPFVLDVSANGPWQVTITY